MVAKVTGVFGYSAVLVLMFGWLCYYSWDLCVSRGCQGIPYFCWLQKLTPVISSCPLSLMIVR